MGQKKKTKARTGAGALGARRGRALESECRTKAPFSDEAQLKTPKNKGLKQREVPLKRNKQR